MQAHIVPAPGQRNYSHKKSILFLLQILPFTKIKGGAYHAFAGQIDHKAEASTTANAPPRRLRRAAKALASPDAPLACIAEPMQIGGSGDGNTSSDGGVTSGGSGVGDATGNGEPDRGCYVVWTCTAANDEKSDVS